MSISIPKPEGLMCRLRAPRIEKGLSMVVYQDRQINHTKNRGQKISLEDPGVAIAYDVF